jgi:curli biogenesis system outer membrane secretion channel CsgG
MTQVIISLRDTLTIVLLCLLLTSCTTTASYHALEPAKAKRTVQSMSVSVMTIPGDSAGLAEQLERALSNRKVNEKAYFTVLARKELNRLNHLNSAYQADHDSAKTIQQIGSLIGADAVITGEISDASTQFDFYRVPSLLCGIDCFTRDRLCSVMETRLSVSLKLIDTKLAETLYSNNYSYRRSYDACRGWFPSQYTALNGLAKEIADQFASEISPNQVRYKVVLLDRPDISYTPPQQQQLKEGLSNIQSNNIVQAEQLFSQLLKSTANRSYVAAYNLAVSKEMQQQYLSAKSLYQLARQLSSSTVPEIEQALTRTNKHITQQQKLEQQLDDSSD